ncbi:MAG TPA: hypothetical protein VKP64_08270 [Mycobacteriales bacterium]|nr:hypothetical protein [Mycobacteriales bacterium]
MLLAACGAVVLLHTVAWALAATPATLVTLAAAAVAALTAGLLAAAALASPVPSGAVLSKAALSGAALLTAAEMFALARAAHAPVARAGFLLALAGLGVVAAGTARRRRPDGPWLEVSGALAYVAGLTAALADPGWTSYALAAGGLAALAVALRAERRRVAWAGAALLTGSGWVRLSLERVGAPEAYLAPLGAVAIGLGHLRRTRDPAVSSWRAYGAGLGLALLPSLLVILDGDPGLARPLLLGVAALVALLAGARARLAAPLIVGAGVLGVDAAV